MRGSSPIDESDGQKDEKQRVRRLSMGDSDGYKDEKQRVRRLSMGESDGNKDEKQRVRRLSMGDEKNLERERSRKMSVTTYLMDGRVKRLSSMCLDDKDPIDSRTRRRANSLSTSTSIEVLIQSPSFSANKNSLFSPQRAQQIHGSSMTIIGESKHRSISQGPQFENSYHMDMCEHIDQTLIKHLIYTILSNNFRDMIYSDIASSMGEHIKRASESIKNVVKSLQLRRYKIVATVIVAQNKEQGIIQSSRCLSSPQNDQWIDATFRNPTMIVNGTVYLMYFE